MKAYLGDGAYVEDEDGLLRIYTSDGISDTNEVFLGAQEWASLVDFVKRLREEKELE